MKKSRCFVLCAIILIFMSTYATSGYAKNWTKENVAATHEWTITFSKEVDVALFNHYATLTDAKGVPIPFTAHLEGTQIVKVKAPTDGYTAGQTYTLTIPTTVLSKAKEPLVEATTLTFTIQAAEKPVEKPAPVEPTPPVEEKPVEKPAPVEPTPPVEEKPIEKPKPTNGLSADEQTLANLINDYRASLGLKAMPISKSLTTVARLHVKDSNEHSPEKRKDRGQQCNLHSWSNNGNWKAVCYTPDHFYSALMWSKPAELTAYKGQGYEISVMSTKLTPQTAIALWKKSPGHEETMTGKGMWSMLKTMGVAIEGNYAHVWFGSVNDPAGYYD